MSDPVVDTQFVPGTVITSAWLNGVNDFVNTDGATKVYADAAALTAANAVRTDLANTTDPLKGAAMVGYKSSLANSVARTVKSKLDESVSVKDFGAVGDGITDDTTAFTNAAASGGGVIHVPEGTYLLSSAITIGNQQYWVGDGQDLTTINSSSTTADIFLIPNGTCGIFDMTITRSASTTAGRHIYSSSMVGPTYIHRVTIVNYFVGIELNGTGQFVTDIVVRDSTQPASSTSYGILISGGNDQFISNIIGNNAVGKEGTAGLAITQCEGAWVTDSDFIHFKNGVLIAPSGSGFVRFLFFQNVACDTSTDNGWYFLTGGTARITTSAFSNCWAASSTNNGILCQGTGGAINGLTWSNTRLVNNGTHGASYQNNISNIVMTGGFITGNSATTPGSSYGIHIGANQNDFTFNGIRIGPVGDFADTQLAGVRVDAGTGNRISIVGCNLNTANTPVDNQGSGTNNVISDCTGCILTGFVSTTTDTNGHVTVTHNTGTAPRSIIVTTQNDSTAIFAQASGVSTTTNFQVKFFSQSGAALVSSAISFSWAIAF